MRTETVGQEAEAKRAVAGFLRRRGQRRDAPCDHLRACAGAGELFVGARVLAEEGERLHHAPAIAHGGADLGRKPFEVAPVAQLAAPVQQVRGEERLVRQQAIRMLVGLRGGFGFTGVFQRVAQPERDAGMLRCLRGRLPQRVGGLCMSALHPVAATKPGQGLRMAGSQRQCLRGSAQSGFRVAVIKLRIRQHHPGDEIQGSVLHALTQLRTRAARIVSGHVRGRGRSWARGDTRRYARQ